jgi:zinc-ribbon domain
MFCPRCGSEQPSSYRFCPACGTRLPWEALRQRGPKMTRWFRGIPILPEEHPGMALRVSRYIDEFEMEAPEGSVRVLSHHVRFSVWVDDQAMCAVSIPDDEAESLAQFLLAPVRAERPAAVQ